jgi:hypothetical protein
MISPSLKIAAASLTVGIIIGACAAGANQPNMQAAIGSLQAARAELLRAPANKGGHRDRAIQFVDSAIAETRAGIAYAGN